MEKAKETEGGENPDEPTEDDDDDDKGKTADALGKIMKKLNTMDAQIKQLQKTKIRMILKKPKMVKTIQMTSQPKMMVIWPKPNQLRN